MVAVTEETCGLCHKPLNECYDDHTTIKLSRYERDNLLSALWAIAGYAGKSPLNALNTGDWVLQLAWKLKPAADLECGRPNATPEEAVASANAPWRRAEIHPE